MSNHSEGDYKLRILRLSTFAIASVVIVEVVLGLAISSLAILSDGLHALLDVVTSVMLFLATKEALKPPDEKHTYGHEKFEPIGGLIAGIVLLGVGALVIYEAVFKLIQGEGVNQEFGFAGFFAVGYTFFVDILRMYIFRKAKSSKSTTVKAGFYHALADLSSTVIAFFGFGLAVIGVYQGDSISSIMLGILLSYMSVRLVRGSTIELSDTVSENLVQRTKRIVLSNKGILDCRNLKLREVGSKIFTEFTLQVSSFMSLEEAHALATKIEEQLMENFGIVEATIHIEPAKKETNIEKLVEKLAIVEDVKEVHNILTVYESGKLFVTLHACANPNLSVEEAHKIAEKIEKRMQATIKPLENVTVHLEPYAVEKRVLKMEDSELEDLINEIARKAKTNLRLKRTVGYQANGKRYINIDCCFLGKVSLAKAHEIASSIEKEVAENLADTVVTVHIEPDCQDS